MLFVYFNFNDLWQIRQRVSVGFCIGLLIYNECRLPTAVIQIPQPMSPGEAKEIVDTLRILPVQDIDMTMVKRAIDTHEMYQNSYWESLIIIAAERAGCRISLSEDLSDGQTYHNTLMNNPFKDEQMIS